MKAIFKREFYAYFTTPLGYVFAGLFLCANSLIFGFCTLKAGASSDVYTYFSYLIMGFILVIPILTMKLFAEEKKNKSEVLLLTAPVMLWKVVTAKFLASYSLFIGVLLLGSINFIVLYCYGTPNVAVVFGSLFGVALVGAACIAVGMFISALTENQLIACIGGMGVLLFFVMTSFFNSAITSKGLRVILSWISILTRFQKFCYGIFDFPALIYFVSLTAIFIFLTVRVFESRRWA